MVPATSGLYRRLFKGSEARSRLARIQNRGSCPADRIHELRGERSDAGKAL
jgi:hypothetical protein